LVVENRDVTAVDDAVDVTAADYEEDVIAVEDEVLLYIFINTILAVQANGRCHR
jgi:hypothetical protein